MKDNNIENSKEKQLGAISVATPQTYEQYLKVTTPKTWVVLFSVVVVILGFFVWCLFGHLEVTCDVVIQNIDGMSYALIPQEHLSEAMSEPVVTVDEVKYELSKNTQDPITLSDTTAPYIKTKGNLQNGSVVYPLAVNGYACNDFATGKIIIERVSPIQLLLDK